MPFLALTTTPFMAPSSAEETLPVRAGGALGSADAGIAKPVRAKAAAMRTKSRERMNLSKQACGLWLAGGFRRHRSVDVRLCGDGAVTHRLSFICNVGKVGFARKSSTHPTN